MVSAMSIVIMASGCTGTVSPTPSPTVPTATATPSPSAKPTPEPTATPTPAPTPIAYPGPPIPPGTLTIEIGADPHNKFDRTELNAPADTPFVIALDNRDVCAPTACFGQTSIAHNVAIRLGNDLIFNPLPAIFAPVQADYFIPEGLSAGTYQFVCIVHPLVMNGSLTIE
jgi:hypothetical protein